MTVFSFSYILTAFIQWPELKKNHFFVMNNCIAETFISHEIPRHVFHCAVCKENCDSCSTAAAVKILCAFAHLTFYVIVKHILIHALRMEFFFCFLLHNNEHVDFHFFVFGFMNFKLYISFAFRWFIIWWINFIETKQ